MSWGESGDVSADSPRFTLDFSRIMIIILYMIAHNEIVYDINHAEELLLRELLNNAMRSLEME